MYIKLHNKFETKCSICKKKMIIGQNIKWNPKTKEVLHPKCLNDRSEARKRIRWNVENPILAGSFNGKK